jgi:hypothetical protein
MGIQKEQFELNGLIELSEPKVVSELYIPKQSANLPRHWDIEFVFPEAPTLRNCASRTRGQRSNSLELAIFTKVTFPATRTTSSNIGLQEAG